jgi:hypothetical protein
MPRWLVMVTNMGRPWACYIVMDRVLLTGAEGGTVRA